MLSELQHDWTAPPHRLGRWWPPVGAGQLSTPFRHGSDGGLLHAHPQFKIWGSR